LGLAVKRGVTGATAISILLLDGDKNRTAKDRRMDVSPTFELINTRANTFIFSDVVRLEAGAAELRPLAHFHPQIELVWFRKVTGSVRLGNDSIPLSDGQAVLLPSMQVHAFETGRGARDWVLLQVEPFLLEPILRQPQFRDLNTPAILRPLPEVAARIDLLCDWLAGITGQADRAIEAQRILELILVLLAGVAKAGNAILPSPTRPPDQLQQVLAMIHADPRTAPALAQAARMLNLTDSYFSRLFKARVDMGYAAYLQMHRLNVAAQLLVSGPLQVSQIAYAVGFASAAHFSTVFSQRFGLTPSACRLRALATRQQETESE
jgi:AraC-like DNA-binding protein